MSIPFKSLVTVFIALALVESGYAGNLTWDAGNTANGSTIDPASGTWDTTSLVWNNGTSDVAWTSANVAQFGGADGIYAITVGTGITVQNIVFLNSGYVLSAASAQTITMSTAGSGAAPNVQASAGKTGSISNNVTINITASTAVLGGVAGNAGSRTIVVDSGGALKHTGNGSFITTGTATLRVKTGGLLLAASTAGTQVTLGGGTAGTDLPVLIVDGGTFSNTVTGGPLNVGNNNSATLTITNGGLVAMAQNVSKPLQLGSTASGGKIGTVNLDGGTLVVNQVLNGASGNTSIFNFNSGVLKPNNSANTANFMSTLTTANVRNGGAVIDNNSFAVTIAQALLHSTIGGDNATDGGLISQGTGTNTLTGANTFNGPTVVKSGTLFTTTANIGAGAYSISNSATLGVTVAGAGGFLAASALTLGTAPGDVLTNAFAIGANSSTTTAPIAVSGALALNGTVTINVSGTGFAGPNIYPLISYGSISGSGSIVAGTLPAVSGYLVSLTNDTTAKAIEMVLSLPPQPVSWAVGNGAWDTTAYNWTPLGGGVATNYSEGVLVAFDDSASGTSPITVTLASGRTPGIVTNNSTKNYVLAGNFNINSPQLIKSGSGILTLDNGSGNLFGGILINNGTLQVGSNDTGGSLGSGAVTNNGTLRFNRTDSPAFANVLSGTGGITQSGSGTVTVSGSNSYAGNTAVNAGKLTTTTSSTGAGSYSVADGTTLEVQVSASGASLTNSSLTLGTSGALTLAVTLGSFASTTVPVIKVNGALALNGTVTVNVSGSGLTTGTYPLISYGSYSGSGSFVLGSIPSVGGNAFTLTNDTSVGQIKLVLTAVTALTWDSGNTANGATIDAGSGTWDMNLANVVWNDGAVNRPWVNSVDGTFAGADGAWAISLAGSVTPKTLSFLNDGYVISAPSAQSITLGTGSGATPNLKIAPGKTAAIGTNVTLQATSANNLIIGGPLGTGNPGGILVVTNGGTVQVAGNATLGLVGVGTLVSVQPGGLFGRTSAGSFLLGSIAGDNCTLSVDGGSVSIAGSGVVQIGGNGTAATVAGTLNLNSGSFSMDPANTTVPMKLGVNASNLGTNNLNGGTLSVNQIVKGNASAIAVVNFNGGTLRAVNGALTANFLSGIDTANVRNGGAVLNNNSFNVTIGQALVHSTIAGDNVMDGGLTCLGSGTLTLTGANTYTGGTTITAGTLALNGSALISSTPSIALAAGSKFDVSGLASTFALNVGQTITNNSGTGMIAGNVNLASGALALNFTNGAPSLNVTNGTLNFNGNPVVVNVAGTLLRGAYKLISTNTGGFVTGTLPSSATVNGIGNVVASLNISNSELYLIVDHPPVAQIMTATRTAGLNLHVSLADLATNWSDADGDAVVLSGVNPVTTNGVNLVTDSNWIYYTNNLNVNDQISYSISDGFGGTNTGYINIVINNSVTGTNSIIGITTGSTNVVRAFGIPGFNYILERATNLAPVVWVDVSTNSASTNGLINATDAFNDLGNMPPASAYYRLKWQP